MKANDKYSNTGDPNVKKEVYIKNKRMEEVGILNFSPSRVQTPNAYFSMNSCIICDYDTKINKSYLR